MQRFLNICKLATQIAKSKEIPSEGLHSILPLLCWPGDLLWVLDQGVLLDTICTALPKHQGAN